jgi:hypothetical protein
MKEWSNSCVQENSLDGTIMFRHVSGGRTEWSAGTIEAGSRKESEGLLPMKKISVLNVVVHVCNPSTQEADAGESQVQGHPRVQRDFKANLSYIVRPGSVPPSHTHIHTKKNAISSDKRPQELPTFTQENS